MKLIKIVCFLAVAVGCVVFILPFVSRTVPTNDVAALWSKQVMKLHSLGVAIQHYQAEKGTSAWPTWTQLLEYGGPDVSTQFGAFTFPETGKFLNWWFLVEGNPTAEGHFILIAAPLPRPADEHSNGKELRAVLWSDFKAGFIDEAEFQRTISVSQQ
jgi:hypothetical protein